MVIFASSLEFYSAPLDTTLLVPVAVGHGSKLLGLTNGLCESCVN